ncbi:hypothetical protein [Dechloromonas sp. H13]|uniref:hypothetical protein n=1 Tax=Dechloromonas sp. H13 TaxID=2570193 RepID=UPI00129133DB|nr:hypothetical protein [Dechloromonas sp. H13]
MVITDIDSAYRSREASGRFEVAPTSSRRQPAPPAIDWLRIDVQAARNRAQAITAARRILNA